ncbi:alanine racemase, partial [Chlamydiia bacterium]|nr:alanine racemase [Chlamydiia bacterium]
KKLSQTYLIGTKVLILSASTQIEYEQIVKNGWEVCIHDINGLKLLDSVCRKLNKTIQIHVNIDTGMNRLGVKNIEEFANSLRSTKRVIPSGIMTHLVSSNNSEHIQGTTQQINKFRQHLSYFHSLGLTFRYQHVMNTNGVIQHNQILQANTIRPGIGLYYPCRTIRTKHSNMKPIFEYWGKIINIQSCHAGENIGYGFHHKLKNDSVIAVISVGYSDGIFRKQTNNKLSVKIDGYDCPMVGLTCMDCCFVDVTRLTRKPSVGQYVQITSNDPNSLNYVDHYLVSSNKSHHEFLCSISQHALRIEKNQFHRLINHR